MATTYEPIATTTLGSAAASINFTSISSAYTDLRLVFMMPTSSNGTNSVYVQFNGDTTTNYSNTRLQGNGAAAASARQTNQTEIQLTQSQTSTTYPTMIQMDIMSYSGSTNKTILSNTSADFNGSGVQTLRVGLWRSTAAINRVYLFVDSGNMNAGTTATLYGILKA